MKITQTTRDTRKQRAIATLRGTLYRLGEQSDVSWNVAETVRRLPLETMTTDMLIDVQRILRGVESQMAELRYLLTEATARREA